MFNPLIERLAGLDWTALEQSLDEHGFAKLPPLAAIL